MLEFGDIVTFENDKEYVVASNCTYENNIYVVLRPLGVKKENAPRKIYQIEKILPGTIYEVLRTIPKNKGSLYLKR